MVLVDAAFLVAELIFSQFGFGLALDLRFGRANAELGLQPEMEKTAQHVWVDLEAPLFDHPVQQPYGLE